MVFDRGIMRPDQLPGAPFDMDFGYFHMATQPFLKVDIEGERITNESSPYDFLIHALARKSSQRAWFDIWDSNWPTDIQRFHTIGCSGLIKGEGTNQMDPEGVEGTAAIIDALVEEGKIVKADTLEEIADAFGINKETFLATVEQYNGFYDAQNDTQYGKEPFRLSEIRTAPFYACKLSGMALATLDGIKINTKFQALDENNAPIEGLYVIGNDSGNYYNGTYPNLAAGRTRAAASPSACSAAARWPTCKLALRHLARFSARNLRALLSGGASLRGAAFPFQGQAPEEPLQWRRLMKRERPQGGNRCAATKWRNWRA